MTAILKKSVYLKKCLNVILTQMKKNPQDKRCNWAQPVSFISKTNKIKKLNQQKRNRIFVLQYDKLCDPR